MSIKLEKRAAAVGIILAKRGITKVPPTRVGVALDVSGSAEGFYTSGIMQETIDRLLAVALKFDDNGELDAWLFHHGVMTVPTITEADEGSYVKKQVLTRKDLWGATNYAPALSAVMSHYFGGSTAGVLAEKASGFLGGLFGKKAAAPAPAPAAGKADPAMLLFITDGANNDEAETRRVLQEAAKNSPVYFNMVGIGPASNFRFIERMADELPNVGFVNLNDLSITDEQLYEAVVNAEFCEWIKKI